MKKRVVLMNVGVAMGLAATVLGYVAGKKSKGFLRFEDLDGQQHCVYPRNPALGCGVAAALLALTGVTLATVATIDRLALTGVPLAVAVRRIAATEKRLGAAWVAVLMATVTFLWGAAMKRGLSRQGWHHGRYYNYGCTGLRSDLFFAASVVSALATVAAIAAYVLTDEDEPAPPGVEMGQPQWAQPYPPPPPMANPAPGVAMGQPPQWAQPYPPPPPVANPAPPPQYGHGGYGPSQPAAGTA